MGAPLASSSRPFHRARPAPCPLLACPPALFPRAGARPSHLAKLPRLDHARLTRLGLAITVGQRGRRHVARTRLPLARLVFAGRLGALFAHTRTVGRPAPAVVVVVIMAEVMARADCGGDSGADGGAGWGGEDIHL
eukprot:357744-Chlamydomonas_euryale.AAC.3